MTQTALDAPSVMFSTHTAVAIAPNPSAIMLINAASVFRKSTVSTSVARILRRPLLNKGNDPSTEQAKLSDAVKEKEAERVESD